MQSQRGDLRSWLLCQGLDRLGATGVCNANSYTSAGEPAGKCGADTLPEPIMEQVMVSSFK